MKNKVINKVLELKEANEEPYVVITLNSGYCYVFHNNGAYDKVHEKTFGLLTNQSLVANLTSNSLLERAKHVRVCGGSDSWSYYM